MIIYKKNNKFYLTQNYFSFKNIKLLIDGSVSLNDTEITLSNLKSAIKSFGVLEAILDLDKNKYLIGEHKKLDFNLKSLDKKQAEFQLIDLLHSYVHKVIDQIFPLIEKENLENFFVTIKNANKGKNKI